MLSVDTEEHLQKEFIRVAEYPICCNEDPNWILDCLRILDHRFCMRYKRGSYDIVLSSEHYLEVLKEWQRPGDDKGYKRTEILRSMHELIISARVQCDAVLAVFKNKLADEKKILEERITLEQDIRFKYRR